MLYNKYINKNKRSEYLLMFSYIKEKILILYVQNSVANKKYLKIILNIKIV